jgi:hypothetical protein
MKRAIKAKISIYKEQIPNKRFLVYIREWLKSRDLQPTILLVAKPNLVIAVIQNELGRSLICFYVQKLKALGLGGVIVYYDVTALPKVLKQNVNNTFTNWVAQTYLHDN